MDRPSDHWPTLTRDKLKDIPAYRLYCALSSAYCSCCDGRRDFIDIYFNKRFYWVDTKDLVDELETRQRIDLTKLHTRLLLKYLDILRTHSVYVPLNYNYVTTYEDVKAELAKREHVPGKIEAKNNRRTAAMMHRKSKLRGKI